MDNITTLLLSKLTSIPSFLHDVSSDKGISYKLWNVWEKFSLHSTGKISVEFIVIVEDAYRSQI